MPTRPLLAAVLAATAVVVSARTVVAEPYVGFALSGIPSTEHQVKADRTFVTTGVTDRFTVDNVRFDSSVAYGGTIGYRFLPWVAAEIDAFHFSPGVKTQTRTANSPTVGSVGVAVRDGDLDVTGLAILPVGVYSLLKDRRVPEGRLHLYAGAGIGIFFTSVDVRFASPFATLRVDDSDTSVSPYVKAGARWFFTRNLATFAEFRYSWLSIDASGTGTTGAGVPITIRVTGDAEAPVGLLGVSWHFH